MQLIHEYQLIPNKLKSWKNFPRTRMNLCSQMNTLKMDNIELNQQLENIEQLSYVIL